MPMEKLTADDLNKLKGGRSGFRANKEYLAFVAGLRAGQGG